MQPLFSALILALAWLPVGASGALEILDTSFNPANGHTYYLLENSNWTDAELRARELGGHLATINNKEENEWIFQKWGAKRNLWIGFNDAAVEGTFVWASGEAVQFTNWRGGEPNNGGVVGANEDWAYLMAAGHSEQPGQWNDYEDRKLVDPQPPLYGVVECARVVVETPLDAARRLSFVGAVVWCLFGVVPRLRTRSRHSGPLKVSGLN